MLFSSVTQKVSSIDLGETAINHPLFSLAAFLKIPCGRYNNETVDAIVDRWCLFHLPKSDHELMILRFSRSLKPGGILEFTSGDSEFEGTDSSM